MNAPTDWSLTARAQGCGCRKNTPWSWTARGMRGMRTRGVVAGVQALVTCRYSESQYSALGELSNLPG